MMSKVEALKCVVVEVWFRIKDVESGLRPSLSHLECNIL